MEAALDGAKDVHPSGEIIKLPCYCPWKEHLFELEEEKGTNPLPKYALFEDPPARGGFRRFPSPPTRSRTVSRCRRRGEGFGTRRWTR